MKFRVVISLLGIVCCFAMMRHVDAMSVPDDDDVGMAPNDDGTSGIFRRHLMGLHEKHRRCPHNEVYKKCGPNCQKECPTLNQPCLIRHITCPSGCYCRDTFARETIGGDCIPISQCTQRGPFVY